MSLFFLKLSLILLSLQLAIGESRVYHIIPLQSQLMIRNSSLTLSQFAANSSEYVQFHNNMTFILYSGNHILQTEFLLSNVTFFSLTSNESSSARIICRQKDSNLTFIDVAKVHISQVEFVRCTIRFEYVDMLLLKNCVVNGDSAIYVTGLEIVQTDGIIERSSLVFNTKRGAIVVESSNVSVIECNFTENAAKVGGALSSRVNGNIMITACLFTDNKATGCVTNGQDCKGGALHIDNGNIIINQSTFMNNTSEGHGGALSAHDHSTIYLNNSLFNSNKASLCGGAIYERNGSHMIVEGSKFISNSAGASDDEYCNQYSMNVGGGAALYAFSHSNITARKSSFTYNRAFKCDGEAISLKKWSMCIVEDSHFDRNIAGKCGGAVYSYHRSNITVHNSTFYNNHGYHHGGALCPHTHCPLEVSHSVFHNNTGAGQGGAILTFMSRIRVTFSDFFNNQAKGETGGAVYVNGISSVFVNNSVFSHNRAKKIGGAISAREGSEIIAFSSNFTMNNAAVDGGAIGAVRASVVYASDCSLSGNIASIHGGAMYAFDGSNIIVSKTVFDSNSVGKDGGAVYAYTTCTIMVYHSHFIHNRADEDGGCLYALTHSNIIVYKSFFTSSVAADYGGIIFLYTSIATVLHCYMNNSTATVRGGAIYSASYSTFTITSCFFNNNTAQDGGVIFTDRSNATIENSTFIHNRGHNGGVAYTSGGSNTNFTDNSLFSMNSAHLGGVMFIDDAVVIDQDNTYSFNEAAENGGVIYLNNGRVKVAASTFTNNSAMMNGGVLSIISTTEIILIMNSTFYSNKAGKGGGVISMSSGGFLNLSSNVFYNSTAFNGGVLHVLLGTQLIVINKCIFENNRANHDGGAVYSENQTIAITICLFSYNEANNNGGAFCLLRQSYLHFHDGTAIMMHNIASNGGVMYADQSEVVADNNQRAHLLLQNNTALNSTGGSIYLFMSLLAFSNCNATIIHNHAQSGGAISIHSSNISITNDTVINICGNKAEENGGGLYLHSGKFQSSRGTDMFISANVADKKGGGLYAFSSSILVDGVIHITKNSATNGGGMSLENYTEINQGLEEDLHSESAVVLVSNNASSYGGAIYIDDYEMCDDENTTKCFSISRIFYFSGNIASVRGSNLFGGLLDRCSMETYQEIRENFASPGAATFLWLSNVTSIDTVDSDPVQLCFCGDSQPDCKYQPSMQVLRYGETFNVELIAYNQVDRGVSARIMSSLKSSAGGLGDGQDVQSINEACSELQFDIFSPFVLNQLVLKAEGPCQNSKAQRKVKIKFICVCPIGFQMILSDMHNHSSCRCECDPILQHYGFTACNVSNSLSHALVMCGFPISTVPTQVVT